MKNKWVVFDMDGTLWDAVDLICDAWGAVCEEHEGLNAKVDRELLKSLLGRPMDEFAAVLFPHLSTDEGMALLLECVARENALAAERGANIYPGVEEVFRQLIENGWNIGIVSNCQQGYIEAFLSYYDFGKYVSDKLCFGDNGLQKGENIRRLLDRNQAAYGCYVGDTDGDRVASEEAGVPFYFAAYGFGHAESGITVPALKDLPGILGKA